jgi:hypothetical protein
MQRIELFPMSKSGDLAVELLCKEGAKNVSIAHEDQPSGQEQGKSGGDILVFAYSFRLVD